jgi:hypothetical protein
VACLKEVGWGLDAFLTAWVNSNAVIDHLRNATQDKRQRVLQQALAKIPEVGVFSTLDLKDEVAVLLKTPYFGRIEGSVAMEDVNFEAVLQTIQEVAPLWHMLLNETMQHQHAHRDSYGCQRSSTSLSKQMFTVLGIICHSYGPQWSNYSRA